MAQPAVRYRVWVGGLPREIQQDDLGSKFSKYGPIQDITVRHSDVDSYAFVTYTERADAEEAIKRMDRSCAWGAPVKVNISKDFQPNGPRKRGPDGKPVSMPAGSGGAGAIAPLAPPPGWRSPPRRSPPRAQPQRRRSPSQQQRRQRHRSRSRKHRSHGRDRHPHAPVPGPPPRGFSPRGAHPPLPPPRTDYGAPPPSSRGHSSPLRDRDFYQPGPPLPPPRDGRTYSDSAPPRRDYGGYLPPRGYERSSQPSPPRGDYRDHHPPMRGGYSPTRGSGPGAGVGYGDGHGGGHGGGHAGHSADPGPPPRGYSPQLFREPPPPRAPPSPPSRGCATLPAAERPRSAPPQLQIGRHPLTIENIPEDMSWLELKDLGKEYGKSVTFSRTYRRGNVFFGMIEFAEAEDARRTISELDGRRIQGGTVPMRVYEGDSWNA